MIDDASHLYAQTKASFETLFPRVRPGGLYVIEDWAWFHWRGTEESFRGEIPLTKLITQLTEAAGSSGIALIEELYVTSGFVAVRRGATAREDLGNFRLDDWIYRHPDARPSPDPAWKYRVQGGRLVADHPGGWSFQTA